MQRNWKRIAIGAAIAVGSTTITLALDNFGFFQTLALKAQDAHFVVRGKVPTKDIVLIGMDEKSLNKFPEPLLFWHKYYAEAIQGAASAGAKVLVLDVNFAIPVSKWEPENDSALAGAYAAVSPTMPVVLAWVANTADQSDPAFAVPVNMLSSALGGAAMANLTVDDRDDFVRRQVLIESPQPGQASDALKRSMAMRAAEKFLGVDAAIHDGRVYLGKQLVPTDSEFNMTINFAGPTNTFPRVSLYDVIQAVHANNRAQLETWFKGKAVLLGPDVNTSDVHSTPFYTAIGLSDRWQTPGVEIHANTLRTLLTGQFLKPVPQWIHVAGVLIIACITVAVAVSLGVAQTTIWSCVVILAGLVITHALFRFGWLLSSTDIAFGALWAMIGGIIYRFATAEKKSTFFKSAVALFVGKEVAKSLDQSDQISLTGQRQMVTIMFSDIRGFTAFCESKDPAVIVDLLNIYMACMCKIIVSHGGHVNKFIGDGILAVFSDNDEGAAPGTHASRAVQCATDMVNAPIGEFKTGTGMHSGEVVIGNVGSSDKMEFTVLGDTVNLASRLESLNKEHKTKLLLSGSTHEMLGGGVDTVYLGAVPVRGKTEPMKLYTVASLMTDDTRKVHHLDENNRPLSANAVEIEKAVA
jgi:adenylate cyclase